MLTGSVVRIWGALERILSRHEHQLSRSDRTMRVLRVDLGPGNSLIGAPNLSHIRQLLHTLCLCLLHKSCRADCLMIVLFPAAGSEELCPGKHKVIVHVVCVPHALD